MARTQAQRAIWVVETLDAQGNWQEVADPFLRTRYVYDKTTAEWMARSSLRSGTEYRVVVGAGFQS